jgi:hypothetical protein
MAVCKRKEIVYLFRKSKEKTNILNVFVAATTQSMLEAAFRTKNLHKTAPSDLAGQEQEPPDGAALYQRFCRLLQLNQNLYNSPFIFCFYFIQ